MGQPEIFPSLQAAAQRLAQAIRYETVSSEDDPYANADHFHALRHHIEDSYPLITKSLTRETVGPFGLLWRWEGKRPSLKPGVLLAHHDVVPAPAETLKRWTVPPFSGAIEGGFVWGRGTLDNKGNLFAILEAIEHLLAHGFMPQRTIYLFSGCDEEVLGAQGAKVAAGQFRERGIHAAFVLDEGLVITHGIVSGIAKPVALIGIAEKGYWTATLKAVIPNEGHASNPSPQSIATLLGARIAKLEREAFTPALNPLVAEMMKALSAHMPFPQRFLMRHPRVFGKAIIKALSKSDASRAQLQTTVAVTWFRSGGSENALPSLAEAKVNFRIALGSSIAETRARVRALLDAGIEIVEPANACEPSETSSVNAPAYLAIKAAIGAAAPYAITAPGLFTGHADAIYFEDVADNVYRFSPLQLRESDIARIHGIDERLSLDHFASMITFYEAFLLQTG